MNYSACLELLFTKEADSFADRIGLAADAGFTAVEFWGWRNKDIPSIRRALRASGVRLVGLVSEPMAPLTDRSRHDAFLEGLAESIEVAQDLGARTLIAQAGNERAGVPRPQQAAAIVEALERAADVLMSTGVVLALEPLNTRVDHPGYYLHSTAEAVELISAVDREEIRLLYDLYHSFVMGEDVERVLGGHTDLVAHVHLADAPGRREPGSGAMDWGRRLAWLEEQGYRGYVGLEYTPTAGTKDSLRDLGIA